MAVHEGFAGAVTHEIGIFNRSYYEEVLIVRVHPEILRGEGLAEVPHDMDKLWRRRFRSINGLERHLHDNGTRIIKFFLHLSKDEQRQRFLARIEEAKKNWKFSVADIQERAFWDDYQAAYERLPERNQHRSRRRGTSFPPMTSEMPD